MRVCGKLETLVSMRLQPEGMPEPDDGGLGKPKLLGHQSRAPMRGVFGFLMKCGVHDGLDFLILDRSWSPATSRISKGYKPLPQEATAPLTNCLIRKSQFIGYVDTFHAFGG